MVNVELSHLAAIARRHGLLSPENVPSPWIGATSRVYPCGDAVIKVAFDQPDAIASVMTDAAMNPVARAAGVRVPELIAIDDSRDLLPVPYAVYRRVMDAVPLDAFAGDQTLVDAAWQAVGHDLARVHAVAYGTSMPVTLRAFRQSPEVDPRPWVNTLHGRGHLDATDAAWMLDLLARLAPAALADVSLHLCHGDVNAANVMVDAVTGEYRALIDWAGAGWLDPVWDFAGISLVNIPAMLAGHRSIAPLPDDGSAEARILWCQIQTRLHAAISQPEPHLAAVHLPGSIGQIRAFVTTTGL